MQILIGLLNTSNVMTSTCIGELTDTSTMISVFRWIPVIRDLGDGIAGGIAGAVISPKPNATVIATMWPLFHNAIKEEGKSPYFPQ